MRSDPARVALGFSPLLLAVLLLGTGCGDGPPEEGDGGDPLARPDGAVGLCAANRDCDDDLFCNGREVCEPGASGADARGCAPGDPVCPEGSVCDEENRRCADCDEPDLDGDGDARPMCGGGDCDDFDPLRSSLNQEVCDGMGRDEDCDASTIQNADLRDGDADGDGVVSSECSNPDGDDFVVQGRDCDDDAAGVFPGATENCNFIDDDCDGNTDEGVEETYYFDMDSDGFGDRSRPMMSCVRPEGHRADGSDCDDTTEAVNPGRTEVCNGVDDNCDGTVDNVDGEACECTEGMTATCGSEVGDCALLRGTQTCREGRWSACEGAATPTPELCGGGDEDCDGSMDEDDAVGMVRVYPDVDGDGFGAGEAVFRCVVDGEAPEGFSLVDTDCIDSSASRSHLIHPGATFQTVPHCDGSATCDRGGGQYGCRSCSDLGCLCLATASFDYDCNGAIDVGPAYACEFLGSCRSGHVDPSSSECGMSSTYRACVGVAGCMTFDMARALPCR